MKVLLHRDAAKYFERLSATDKGRLQVAFTGLEEEPPKGDIKPLVGQPNQHRLRVGSYRILFRIENNAIFILSIDPRGQAYKKKNRGK